YDARPAGMILRAPSAPRGMCGRSPEANTPALMRSVGISGRAIGPGREHYFPPVWVLVGNAAVVLPVVDLRDRVDARSGQPCRDALPGASIRQVKHQLIKPGRRLAAVPQPDDLQVDRAAGQAKDRPVQAVAFVEGFQHRQPDDVAVEDD